MERPHACGFCASLQRLAIRRRDPALAEAAIRLRQQHAANDGERERFAQQVPPNVAGDENGLARAFRARGRRSSRDR